MIFNNKILKTHDQIFNTIYEPFRKFRATQKGKKVTIVNIHENLRDRYATQELFETVISLALLKSVSIWGALKVPKNCRPKSQNFRFS